MAEKRRVVRRGTVTATERLSPDMVRITLSCPELVGAELPHSDHYVKLLFPPKGADYAWPFDPEVIRAYLGAGDVGDLRAKLKGAVA